MTETHLHHHFTYTDVDREFWERHLDSFVPRDIVDAHVHVVDPSLCIERLTEEQRHAVWVNEVAEPQDAATAERCMGIVYPGRTVSCVGFGWPSVGWDLEAANLNVSTETSRRGWHGLALIRPTWVAGQVEWLLKLPGIIGAKPYYAMIGHDPSGRDRYIESSIYDFLPHHQLEVLDQHGAWVTLHVPRAGRLGHPQNQREVKEIRRRYPRIRLVIAHLGRCYTLSDAEEGLLPLADDAGLYFDNSAVLNPDVHTLALRHIGAQRILYGTDNPVFYMRGRQQWSGRRYIFRTSHPYHFNTERESPDIEAAYTLTMYEAIRAIRNAFERLGLGEREARLVFARNAQRLIGTVTGV